MATEKIPIEVFKTHHDVLKNIRQGFESGRFNFTKMEIDSLNFVIEFMDSGMQTL